MNRVITYSFGENFIEKLADFIGDNFLRDGNDLSNIACVFGGRRPTLFLQKELSQRIKKAYLPPRFFSMDEFIDYLVLSQNRQKISNLDACFLIYSLAKTHIPALLKGRESFSAFLPWAREIISFIEQLDLEAIKNQSLLSIEKSASIGYEIPEGINRLLARIIPLRDAYHRILTERNLSSRGVRYLQAAESVRDGKWEEFRAVLFCNFFYLHKTEQKVIKEIYDRGKGVCLFQGSQQRWSVLAANARNLSLSLEPVKADTQPDFSLYQGFDLHSQVGIAAEILSKIKNKDKTLIVLPQAHTLIPLLTGISHLLDSFNISLGYPLKRSSLYVLFDLIAQAQKQRVGETYYTKDYLNLLRHPLVKNLKLAGNPAIIRIMIHKIEELIQGQEETSIGGSLFLTLKEIEAEEKIYSRSQEVLQTMGIPVDFEECKRLLSSLHRLFFSDWQGISDFYRFSSALLNLLDVLVEKSNLGRFPLNLKAAEKLYQISQELAGLIFSREKFAHDEIWDIFRRKLEAELVSFTGSPLKGTQILGFLETRSLSFENIIALDLNESVLPKLKIYEPLIPREVMLNLGLNRLEKEEEIQRYQFMRLVSSAKKVHLIYEENREKEKSRFLEELLWAKQKKLKKLDVVSIPRARFAMKAASAAPKIKKTPAMVKFMREATYSASRLNTYLNCPLQFYYQYILGLKEQENLLDDPQASHIGTFIHELLADSFKVFIGRKPAIDKSFRKNFYGKLEEKFQKLARRMKSDSFLLKQIIDNRMNKFLDSEVERKVAKIISLENECRSSWELDGEVIRFRYTADRIDQLEDASIVVIDYKTGGANLVPKRLSALSAMKMNRESIRDNLRSFQLPLYYYFTLKEFPNRRVSAEIYNLRTCERKSFISKEDAFQEEKIRELAFSSLAAIFRELFDLQVPFVADRQERKCRFCPFTSLCR